MITFHPNERVICQARKHWFVIVTEGAVFLAIALLPALMSPFLAPLFSSLSITVVGEPSYLSLFGYSLWLLVSLVGFFLAWTDYYLDVWYITNERVIDVEQKGIFNRDEAMLSVGNIQDVTIDTRGLIPTLLHFGDIRIQTSGTDREFVLRNAASPELIRNELITLIRK